MKTYSFLKLLNKKIKKLDERTQNPFEVPHPFLLAWVENPSDSKNIFKTEIKKS